MPKYQPGLSIQGIQEAQAATPPAIAALQPSGALGAAVKYATLAAHRYTVAVTHVGKYRVPKRILKSGKRSKAKTRYVGGGALRASHRAEVHGLTGTIYIDPNTINPRRPHGARPAEYGIYEHARGKGHDFYARVEREYGEKIVATARGIIYGGMP